MARALVSYLGHYISGYISEDGIARRRRIEGIPTLIAFEIAFEGDSETFINCLTSTEKSERRYHGKGTIGSVFLYKQPNELKKAAIGHNVYLRGACFVPGNRLGLQKEIAKYKKVIELAKRLGRDHELAWNSFSATKSSKPQICFFNIDMPGRGSWRRLQEDIFGTNDLSLHYFVFYSSISGRESYEVSEEADCLRAESVFIRKFLYAHHKGLWLGEETESIENIINNIKKSMHSCSKISPKELFARYRSILDKSLVASFGKRIYVLKRPEELSTLSTMAGVMPSVIDGKLLSQLQKKILGISSYTLINKLCRDILVGTVSSHGILSSEEELVSHWRGGEDDHEIERAIGSIHCWYHYLKVVTGLSKLLLRGKFPEKLSVLFIDDRPKSIRRKAKALSGLFPYWTITMLKKNEWKKVRALDSSALPLAEVIESIDSPQTKGMTLRASFYMKSKTSCKINVSDYDLIVVDIEYDAKPEGFEFLHKLRHAFGTYGPPYIVTLSRREDSKTIQQALISGALFYISKDSFFDILGYLYEIGFLIEERRLLKNKELAISQKYRQYENWGQLSKLPLRKMLELQSTIISGEEYDSTIENRWVAELHSSESLEWIRKLPKADVHCHIGSCVGPTLLPRTALQVLSEKCAKENYNYKKKMQAIVNFLLPIVADPFINELQPDSNKTSINDEVLNYKASFGQRTKENKSIFEIIIDAYPLQRDQKNPEQVLLDPNNYAIDDVERYFKTYESSFFFSRKNELRRLSASYDEIMLVFILLIYIRDIRLQDGQPDVTLDSLAHSVEDSINSFPFGKDYKNLLISKICLFKQVWATCRKRIECIIILKSTGNLMHFLQSAHSKKRCLYPGGSSLFNYLRGCEYAGSAHLQTRTAIFMTMDYIINEYAVKDNTRYLSLRCAVDGYSKFNLQSADDALRALLESADIFKERALRQGSSILVNIIITAKRHKPVKELEKNVELAIKYRWGLSSRDPSTEGGSVEPDGTIFNMKPRVESFDLAGLEKGNRATKFRQQFTPIFKQCFPVTIHAGEEDDKDSIWEAVYELHSQRLGHALTLRRDRDLLNIVRERHIGIELCPVSNLLTSGKYIFVDQESVPSIPSEYIKYFAEDEVYPLRQYLDEYLDVSINTDNPYVSDTSLSLEFLVAARLIGGLSKWEVLRLIRNGFKAALLSKKERRRLMNEIDNEIYEILLKEDQGTES